MLKMAGVRLEKIVDNVMYLLIEKGLRGRISYIAKRYVKVNNKQMKDYDSTKPSKYILYLPMNNYMVGWWVIILPCDGFKWLKNVGGFDVESVSENSSIGYILDTDPKYPDELHVFHNDYPLVPEKLAITYDMLSDYCKKIADEYKIKVGDVKKLI